jgi:hypothetical protein
MFQAVKDMSRGPKLVVVMSRRQAGRVPGHEAASFPTDLSAFLTSASDLERGRSSPTFSGNQPYGVEYAYTLWTHHLTPPQHLTIILRAFKV